MDEHLFNNIGKKEIKATAERDGIANDAGFEQAGTPADDEVASDSWIDRPIVTVRVHKVPGGRLYVRRTDSGDDPPPIPSSSIDVTRCTRASLENADDCAVDDVWSGAAVDRRALSDLWHRERSHGAGAEDSTPRRRLARDLER